MVFSKIPTVESLIDDLAPNEGYLIAYSGGADSTALLHLFSSQPNVRAIHINHDIQAQALSWQEHCHATCKRLNIPLIIEQASLKDSSENSCRKARYAFFEKHLRPHEMLLTAHHAQDQTETIVLKLLRGTGIKGLAGMSKLRKFAHGYLARPLLDYSPEILKAYLNQNDISWINDESNYNNDYKRNYLRNNILPLLKQQFTHPIKNINRSAKNSRHSLELLNHLADFQGNGLSIQKLTALPNHLQATMLYHWLSLKNLPTPDTATLKQITDDFIHAAMDKHPHYQNSYYQLYRWQDAVYCIQNFEIIDSESEFAWNTEMPFELPNGCGKLEYTGNKSLNLVIKFKQTGQKIQTHKHAFRKSTKQLLQENKISPWQRQNTPFIYLNKELISLGYDWSNSKEFQDNITFNLHRFNI